MVRSRCFFMNVVMACLVVLFMLIAGISAANNFAGTGSLATAREYHTATLLPNGKVLVAGGLDNNGNALSSAVLYDPAAGTWSNTGSLATARYFHTATLLSNGKVLVAAGDGNIGYLSSAELYDPVAGTWSATGSLATGRDTFTATLLPNGKVLVGGLGKQWLYQQCRALQSCIGHLEHHRLPRQ